MAAVESIASRAAFTLGDEVEAFEQRVRRLLRHRALRSRSPRAPRRSCSRCAGWASAPATRSSSPPTPSSRPPRRSRSSARRRRSVDVDPVTCHLTAAHVADAIGPRTQGRDPGPPLRRDRRHGPDPARSPATPASPSSRTPARRHGARIGEPPRRRRRPRRLLQLLPDQEPRRLGRRRRDHDLRPDARRAHPPAARARRGPAAAATTTRCRARPPASTRSRPRCCASSCATSRTGRRRAAPTPRDLTERARRRRPRRCPVVPDGGDHVFHLYVVRSERSRRAARALAEQGVASAIHYPIPIHRTEAYADLGTGDACRSPSGSPTPSSRCRCGPGWRTASSTASSTRSAPRSSRSGARAASPGTRVLGLAP